MEFSFGKCDFTNKRGGFVTDMGGEGGTALSTYSPIRKRIIFGKLWAIWREFWKNLENIDICILPERTYSLLKTFSEVTQRNPENFSLKLIDFRFKMGYLLRPLFRFKMGYLLRPPVHITSLPAWTLLWHCCVTGDSYCLDQFLHRRICTYFFWDEVLVPLVH